MSAQQNHFRGLPLIIKLDEPSAEGAAIPGRVQVLRTGTFTHPVYGEFQITPQILSEMKANFDSGARGVDLAIDFGHESDKEAAAWIKSLELSDDGQSLWLNVEWTPAGQASVAAKEYRYLSADFSFNYQNNETNQEMGPTLFGAGLTNRPVIKEMAPIVQLQEASSQDALHKAQQERASKYGIEITKDSALTPPAGSPSNADAYGDPVNYKYPMPDKAHAANARVRFKQVASQVYSKPESIKTVHERIVRKELSFGIVPSFDEKDSLDSQLPSELKTKLTKPTKMSEGVIMDPKDQKIAELEAKVKELQAQVAGDPAADKQMPPDMQAMHAKMADMQKKLEEYQAAEAAAKQAQCLAEKKSKFDLMLSEAKVVEAQREAFMKDDFAKFTELAQPLKLAEVGHGGQPAATTAAKEGASAEEQIVILAEEKIKADPKLTRGEAIRKVLAEKPELKKAYNEKK